MYAVIKTGGKQYRVEEGQTLDVERLGDDDLEFSPVLSSDDLLEIISAGCASGRLRAISRRQGLGARVARGALAPSRRSRARTRRRSRPTGLAASPATRS